MTTLQAMIIDVKDHVTLACNQNMNWVLQGASYKRAII